jgi:hypothetical protein
MVAFKKLVELSDGKIDVKYHMQLMRTALISSLSGS